MRYPDIPKLGTTIAWVGKRTIPRLSLRFEGYYYVHVYSWGGKWDSTLRVTQQAGSARACLPACLPPRHRIEFRAYGWSREQCQSASVVNGYTTKPVLSSRRQQAKTLFSAVPSRVSLLCSRLRSASTFLAITLVANRVELNRHARRGSTAPKYAGLRRELGQERRFVIPRLLLRGSGEVTWPKHYILHTVR